MLDSLARTFRSTCRVRPPAPRLAVAALAVVMCGVPLAAAAKTLSGRLTYDRVPATLSGGLDYASVRQLPIRNAKVEVIGTDGKVIDRAMSGEDGRYSVKIPNKVDRATVRVLAETDKPSVRAVDNTNGDALYTMQSDPVSLAAEATTLNLNAASGWDGYAYSSPRTAAPFACLDTIYTAAQRFLAVRPRATFPPLLVKWSVDNRPEDGDPAKGQIGTSHYNGAVTSLYILGKEDVDTDEFDAHVMAHEWGHYFEDKLSRSDSPGGTHGAGDIVDPRLAFGEGWGNALSAMVLYPDSNYKDTGGESQASTNLVIRMEDNLSQDPHPGWYSEASVQTILYDLFDPTTTEAFDQVALGLGPIYDVMTGAQKKTEALTTILSFVSALKTELGSKKATADPSAIDTLVAYHGITPVADEYGSTETHFGVSPADLPIYKQATAGGADVTLTFQADVDLDNRLGANRYVVFEGGNGRTTRITVTSAQDVSITVYDQGKVVARADESYSGEETVEVATKGNRSYVLVVQGMVTGGTGTYPATVHID